MSRYLAVQGSRLIYGRDLVSREAWLKAEQFHRRSFAVASCEVDSLHVEWRDGNCWLMANGHRVARAETPA